MNTVTLNENEMAKCKEYAKKWHLTPNYKVKWGRDKDKALEDTIIGIMYEMAVAKYLNLDYDGNVNKFSDYDVGKYEVRGTTYANGNLILHPEDKEAPYILVIKNGNQFTLAGWINAKDGKKEEYWRTDIRFPCYFVPQYKLNDMDSLK